MTDRSKAPDAAAATNNSGAPRTRCSVAADAFDLSWTVKQQLSVKFNINNSNVSSQFFKLTFNDRSADKRSGAVVSRPPSPSLPVRRERERSAAAADASDLVGIDVMSA